MNQPRHVFGDDAVFIGGVTERRNGPAAAPKSVPKLRTVDSRSIKGYPIINLLNLQGRATEIDFRVKNLT